MVDVLSVVFLRAKSIRVDSLDVRISTCILIGLEIFIFHFFPKIKMQPPNCGFFFLHL